MRYAGVTLQLQVQAKRILYVKTTKPAAERLRDQVPEAGSLGATLVLQNTIEAIQIQIRTVKDRKFEVKDMMAEITTVSATSR